MDRIFTLNQLLQQNPDDIFLHYALAMEYMSTNENGAAIEKLEWIRSKQSDYLPLYYQLAHLYEDNSDIDKAVEIYEAGILLASTQDDRKTAAELKSALEELLF